MNGPLGRVLLLKTGVGNSFGLAGHIGNKIGLCVQYKFHMELFHLSFEIEWALSSQFSEKKHFKRHFIINLKNVRGPTLRYLTD